MIHYFVQKMKMSIVYTKAIYDPPPLFSLYFSCNFAQYALTPSLFFHIIIFKTLCPEH